MSFIRYNPLHTRSGAPSVTLRKDHVMAFNQSAVKEFNLGEYTHAVLYVDAESQRVGVELVTKTEDGAFKFTHKKSLCYLNARLFMKTYAPWLKESVSRTLSIGSESGVDMLLFSIAEKAREK